MAEACPDSRRCLPAWMTKPCSSNEVSNTDRDKQVVESGALDKVKPIRRKIKTVDTEAAGEPRAVQRSRGREKARKKSKDAADRDEFDEMEKISWKNVKKVTGRAPPKNSTKKKLENVDSEASSSGITDDEMELTAGNSRGLQRCQGREMSRRKRNDADYAAKDDLEEIEKPTRKNVAKVTGRAAQKNSRKRKLDNFESEALSSDTIDDEIELTVEDLVRIAEEIVIADKEKLQDIRTTKTTRYEEHPPSPPASTSSHRGGPVSSTWSTQGLMQCTATTANKTPSECRVDKSHGDEEPQRLSSIEMTGDGAQDMLNILLGPMWSKTAAYEKKSEPAAYEKKSEPAAYEKKSEPASYEKKTEPAAYEKKSEPVAYEKKSEVMGPATMKMKVNHVLAPRKKDWQGVQQVQVQGKKKSSLKDMVAMFL